MANGEWHWVHGHSGHIQDESKVRPPIRFGWGLHFYHDFGMNWVHFAIPTQGTKSVQFIRLKFATSGKNAQVQTADVYDGNVVFAAQMLIWPQYGPAVEIELDLGQKWTVYRALGVSIGIVAGLLEGHWTPPWFEFIFVGANLE